MKSNTADRIEISIESEKVCPKSIPSGSATSGGSSLSGFATFLIVIFSLFTGYLAFGSVYNYVVNRITDFPEMVPHIEFWKYCITYLNDLWLNIIEKIRGGSSSTYVRI